MNDRERLHKIAEDLNLPSGRWCFFGSGSMVLHGIDRTMRDVDIFCATQTWFSLLKQTRAAPLPPDAGDNRVPSWEVYTPNPDNPTERCDPPYLYAVMHGIEVNVFFDWRHRGTGDIDVAFWLHNPDEADGLPCIPLQFLLDYKLEVGRAKDVHDINLIRRHLGVTGGNVPKGPQWDN